MEALLLTLSIAVFLLLTLAYLRAAFSVAWGWGLSGIVFPPSWVLFYSIFLDRMRIQAVAHLVALCAVILCSALYIRAHPFEFEDSALSAVRDWVAPAFAVTPLQLQTQKYAADDEVVGYFSQGKNQYAKGRLSGDVLTFVRATWVDGVLQFKSSDKPDQGVEVMIDLLPFEDGSDSINLTFTPESLSVPVVYINVVNDLTGERSTEIYDQGYWLDIMFSKSGEITYSGNVQLKLPDTEKSFVVGVFSALEKDWVMEYGEVDRNYDSNDTIEYVATQYLVNQLGSSLEYIEGLDDTYFQTALHETSAKTTATIRMVDGSHQTIGLSMFKGNAGWTVAHSPLRALIAALQDIEKEPPAAISRKVAQAQIKVFGVDEAHNFLGRSVVVLTQDGRTRAGVMNAVDQYNLSLSTHYDGGEVAMLVKRRDVTEIRIQD